VSSFQYNSKLCSKCSISLVYSLRMSSYFRGDIWRVCVCGAFRWYKVQSHCNNISKRTALGQTIYTYPLRKKIIYIPNNKLGHYSFCTNCKLLRQCLPQLKLYFSWKHHP
jgi:hypothetical protein